MLYGAAFLIGLAGFTVGAVTWALSAWGWLQTARWTEWTLTNVLERPHTTMLGLDQVIIEIWSLPLFMVWPALALVAAFIIYWFAKAHEAGT